MERCDCSTFYTINTFHSYYTQFVVHNCLKMSTDVLYIYHLFSHLHYKRTVSLYSVTSRWQFVVIRCLVSSLLVHLFKRLSE